MDTDTKYTRGVAKSATVTVKNDDAAGLALSDAEVLATDETGSTATFTVDLTSLPTADVTVTVSSSNGAEATVVPESRSLTFTAADWADAKTVTLAGVDDGILDGNVEYEVEFAVQSGNPKYHRLAVQSLSAVNRDNDTTSLSITPSEQEVNEGETAILTVSLSVPVAWEVTVDWGAGAEDDSATAGEDYPVPLAQERTVTFAAADPTPKTIAVPTTQDILAGGRGRDLFHPPDRGQPGGKESHSTLTRARRG